MWQFEPHFKISEKYLTVKDKLRINITKTPFDS